MTNSNYLVTITTIYKGLLDKKNDTFCNSTDCKKKRSFRNALVSLTFFYTFF